jgi:GTP-binding protein
VRVTAAHFVGAATTPKRLPPGGPPEIAVAGRSNVGKSTFLNVLLNRRGLARTSRTPGRTRQLNFFAVNDDAFRFVDLPGFGYAAGPAAERREWGPLVEGYLTGRATLGGTLLLVDVRRGLLEGETMLLDFLAHHASPSALIVTKVDKVGRGGAARVMAECTRARGLPVVGFSSLVRRGRPETWRIVRGWLDDAARVGHKHGR